jgi:hypothetical protein
MTDHDPNPFADCDIIRCYDGRRRSARRTPLAKFATTSERAIEELLRLAGLDPAGILTCTAAQELGKRWGHAQSNSTAQ